MDRQRARGLSAHEDLIADPKVLQPRRERTVRDLDAEELEEVVVVRAHDAVRTHQRFPVDAQPDHDEVTVLEAEARVARRREAEQRAVPVMNGKHALRAYRGHRSPCIRMRRRSSARF